MSAKPLRLDELLESIADGTPVDWDALGASSDAGQQRLLGHLRLVAGVAEVHRTVVTEPADAVTEWPDLGEMGKAMPRWGHLILLEKIGEGAFGEVHRARDPWLDREVALKLMKPNVASQGGIVNEARTLARVRHPNVVTVHGADSNDGRVGLWMDLVRGRTLAQILAADGPCSAAEAAVIGQEVCHALAAVHAAGLVHRDVKAQNVMRESGGRLVLMDFGAGGTPLYLAPEVLAGASPSVASDLYAVGVLLYHLVTDRYPVSGTSIHDLQAAHARGQRTRLGDARPDLPDAFVTSVERALNPDPAQRFPTARAMHDALRQAPMRRLAPWAMVLAAVILAVGVAAGGWLWRTPPRGPQGPAGVTWVAVLPFRSIGPNPETIYYSEGLSEDLNGQLGRLASVRVVSGTSVRRYRDTDKPAAEVGQELKVGALLMGSVRLRDDQLRIVVELVKADTSEQLWAGTFDRPLRDVLSVQNEVVQQVGRALTGSFSSQDASRVERRAIDHRAFDLYLKGRYFSNTRTPDGIRRGIDYFRQAIAIDPESALPFAGLADAYMLAAFYNVAPLRGAHTDAEAAALRAIELEPDLAEAHAALGSLRLDQFRWSEAESSLKRALELNPSYAPAHHWYALWLAEHRRFDEALHRIRDARIADPHSHALGAATAYILFAARRFDEALAEYRDVLTAEPSHFQSHIGIIETHAARGELLDAGRALEDARRLTGREEDLRLSAAYVYALAGDARQSRRRLAEVIADLPRQPASQSEIASVYAALGDLNEAFTWLQRASEARDTLLGYLAIDPRFDRLRGDPRFQTILEELGLAAKERKQG